METIRACTENPISLCVILPKQTRSVKENLYDLKINSKICDFFMQNFLIVKGNLFHPELFAHPRPCQVNGSINPLTSMTIKVKIVSVSVLGDIWSLLICLSKKYIYGLQDYRQCRKVHCSCK